MDAVLNNATEPITETPAVLGVPASVDALRDLTEKLDILSSRISSFESQKTAIPPIEESDSSARDELKKLEARIELRQKNIAIRESILATGVDAMGLEVFSALLEKSHGAELKVVGDDVVHVDAYNRATPIADYVKNFVGRSPISDRFLPAKSLPTGKGLRPSSIVPTGGVDLSTISISELQKMSPQQRQSLFSRGS